MKRPELKIIDTKARYVCESFGISGGTYDLLFKSMHNFFEKSDDYDNMPTVTKTETLELYLQSQDFKDLNFNPSTPNEWFIFGYVFNQIIEHMKGKIDATIGRALRTAMQEHSARRGEEEGGESN